VGPLPAADFQAVVHNEKPPKQVFQLVSAGLVWSNTRIFLVCPAALDDWSLASGTEMVHPNMAREP
jgi:hypothetical protein